MTATTVSADPLYQPTDADIIEELLRRLQVAEPADTSQLIRENVVLTLQVRDLLQQVASYQDAVGPHDPSVPPSIPEVIPAGVGG